MKGSITKQERKTKTAWRVQIYLPTGKDGKSERRVKVFDRKQDAEEWKMNMNLRYFNQNVQLDRSDQPFGDYLDYWLENYAENNVKQKTFEGYKRLIENHIKPRLGDIPLNNVHATDLQEFYNDRLENGKINGGGGLSNNTVRQMHAIIHKAFEKAQQGEWNLLPSQANPADGADAPKAETQTKNTLDQEQVEPFLEAATEESKYGEGIYYLAVFLGLRRGEILGLRWQDVDFDEGRISINQTLLAGDDGLIFDTPKTDKSERPLKVPRQVLGILLKQRNEQNDLRDKLGEGWEGDDHDLVFTANNGSPVRPRNLHREFKRILKVAGIEDMRFHDLRHTNATILMEQGVNPKVVRKQLGHEDVETTLKFYSHATEDLQGEAAQDMTDEIIPDEGDNPGDVQTG